MKSIVLTCAFFASIVAHAATDGVKLIDTSDAQMNAATATARRTLDDFLS